MVKIIEATTKKQMTQFAKFPIKLYEDCDFYVPCFVSDEKNIKNPKKNYAAEGCEVKCFLAYKNGELVGRVAGIIVEESNKKFNEKKIRFSRFDFIDDEEVCSALLKAVEDFGRERGMEFLHGPWGFNDTDREGMLTVGFDSQSTYATNYNYDYYPEFMNNLGYEKESEWVEYRFTPSTLDPRVYKAAEFVKRKYGFVELKGDVKKNVIKQFASVINRKYFSCLLDPKTDKVAAFGVAIPAIGRAIKRHKGILLKSLFSLMREISKPTGLELTLIGVAPEYRNTGINSMIITKIHKNLMENRISDVVCNPMLVDNAGILAQWKWVEHEEIKRRQTYIKPIR